MRTLTSIVPMIVLVLSSSGVSAQQQRTGAAAGPHVGEQTAERDISAIAGGVGFNARAALADQADPDHNVKLVFALATGNYIADVAVRIVDTGSGQTVVQGISKGPWLYAKLPPGDYTVHARYNGATVSRPLSVDGSHEIATNFWWPASVERQAVAGLSEEPLLGTRVQRRER